jgi:hypothetical protein
MDSVVKKIQVKNNLIEAQKTELIILDGLLHATESDMLRLFSVGKLRELQLLTEIDALKASQSTNQEEPLMIGCLTQVAQLYEAGEWSYVRLVEDIGTEKECVTGLLTEGYTLVDSNTHIETPWGTMYWYDFNKENVGLMGWHVIPKKI